MEADRTPSPQSLVAQMLSVRDGFLSAQQELGRMEHIAEGGNGLVSATVSGTGEVIALRLDPDVKRQDPADLEQIILDALQEAQQLAKKHAEQTAASFAQRHTFQ